MALCTEKNMNILVAGGSGFIGTSFINKVFYETDYNICNLDKLTYAATNSFSEEIINSKRYSFIKKDICDANLINLFVKFNPDVIINFAAESHVDNSISSPKTFLKTNIFGTFNLIQNTSQFLNKQRNKNKTNFKFIQISTDEVFGDLNDSTEMYFDEESNYRPSSPYSATKAAADHLMASWQRTYEFPAIKINCSNNYGPYQNREKLIPLVITNAIQGKKIPIYGNGKQKRDWIFVEDHADALIKIVKEAKINSKYNIGARNILTNLDLVKNICQILDKIFPPSKNNFLKQNLQSYYESVIFVKDRPGHDVFYAINPNKIETELSWRPKVSLEHGLTKTIKWYIDIIKKEHQNE